MGNVLRHIVMEYEDVEFCGYSLPHPSESKINFRIQSNYRPAKEILLCGLADLQAFFEGLKNEFTKSI